MNKNPRLLILVIVAFLLFGCATAGLTATDANSAATQSVAPAMANLLVCQDETCLEEGITFNYLIVTRPMFIGSLTDFVQWKTNNGFTVGLATVEWLDASFSGENMAERMKAGMHTLRRDHGVVFALLVGDTQTSETDYSVDQVLDSYNLEDDWNVPIGYYRRGDFDPPSEVLTSDIYFVEDMDWDPQNTGLNPRPTLPGYADMVDASLYVGRWPVRTVEEVAVITAKTLQVQPVSEIFFSLEKALYDSTIGMCPEIPPPADMNGFCYSSDEPTIRLLFNENAPWIETKILFNDTFSAEEAELQKPLWFENTGVIVESYHGYFQGIAALYHEDGSWYLASEYAFQHIFPLLVTQSCQVNLWNMGEEDTFSEAMLKLPTGPASVFMPTNSYYFFQAILDGQSVGEANWRAGFVFINWSNPQGLIGDPSIQAFISPP